MGKLVPQKWKEMNICLCLRNLKSDKDLQGCQKGQICFDCVHLGDVFVILLPEGDDA